MNALGAKNIFPQLFLWSHNNFLKGCHVLLEKIHQYVLFLITGMNPKANIGNISQQAAGYYTLRFAGLFNLPIPICFAFGIGVSQ